MQGRNAWGIWGGLILIGLGLVFLVGQFLQINLWGYIWPLFIIAAGLAFFAGMIAGGRSTGALAVPGSVFVTIGLILFVQNLFGIWATWAYAWALIIVGAGIGLLIFGNRSGIPELRGVSRIVIVVGLAFFFIFGLFFELGAALVGARSPGGIIWPVALILLGLYVLFGRPLFRQWSGPVTRSETGFGEPRRVETVSWQRQNQAEVNQPPAETSQQVPLESPAENRAAGSAAVYGPPAGYQPPSTGDPERSTTSSSLASVNRIRFRAVGDMTIVQGEREGLEIEASAAMKERIISEVRGSELDIRLDENWIDWLNPRYWDFSPVRYTVYVRDLESLEVGGVGNIVIPELNIRRLDLNLTATGNITIRKLAAEALFARLSGLGNIEIAGQVERQEVHLSGTGSYQTSRLESRQADVRLSGLGSAEVWVTGDLSAQVSGAGNIDYYGSPRVDQHVSGLGNIHHKG